MELLHAGAAGTAVVGAAALAPHARRLWREIALAIVMAAAMVDHLLSLTGIPTVVWAFVIVALAFVVAVRPDARRAPARERAMRASAGVGAVLMAALMLVAGAGHSSTSTGHVHGMTLGAVIAVLAILSLAYAVGCLALAWRRKERMLHDTCMTASLVLMLCAVAV